MAEIKPYGHRYEHVERSPVDEASQPHADSACSEQMRTMAGRPCRGVSLSSLTTSNAAGEPALT